MPENKQHTAEFENCIEQVMKQGHEKGSAFAICTKSFRDADKPVYVGEAETQKLHLFSESVKIDGNKVSGVAIHPKRIFHLKKAYYMYTFAKNWRRLRPRSLANPSASTTCMFCHLQTSSPTHGTTLKKTA